MATAARIVSPFPNPSALYISGAKRGNPKPATERRKETAASAVCKKKAISGWFTLPWSRGGRGKEREKEKERVVPDAACKLNVSTTYIWIDWKFRMIPAPMRAVP